MDGGLIIVLGFIVVIMIAIIAFCITDTLQAKYSKELVQAKLDLDKLKLLNKLKVDWEGNPIIYKESEK